MDNLNNYIIQSQTYKIKAWQKENQIKAQSNSMLIVWFRLDSSHSKIRVWIFPPYRPRHSVFAKRIFETEWSVSFLLYVASNAGISISITYGLENNVFPILIEVTPI
jgi:hypothetical protein